MSKNDNIRAWRQVRFGECLEAITVARPKKVPAREYLRSGRFPVVDQGQGLIAGYTDDPSTIIEAGLPYVVFGDHTRLFKFVTFPFALGADGTQLLKPRADFDPHFFYFACLQLKIPSRGYNRHFTAVREMSLPLPPLDLQTQIVKVLALLERAIAIAERTINVSRELKSAALGKVFQTGLRGERQHQTDVGVMPQSWKVRKLEELASARAGVPFPHRYQGKKSGTFPFYKVSDMNAPGNEVRMGAAANWVDPETAEALGAKPFPIDTVLFPKVGGALMTNKKRVLTQPAIVDNNMMGVTVREEREVLPAYLFQWFQSVDLRLLANPGPLPSINARQLYDLLVPVPAPAEQKEIGEALDTMDRAISVASRRLTLLRELFASLLDDLMTGEIRVDKLDFPLTEVSAA